MAGGKENGGSFAKIAFWVLATITTVGLGGVINAMMVNDRLRATEDQRIEYRVNDFKECVNKQYADIRERLVRIEERINIKP